MATPSTIEIDQLAAPIPGDAPAGADLREDPSPTSIYRELKAARKRARDAERLALAPDPDSPPPDPRSEWQFIDQNSRKALTELSKDFEITAWYVEALLREKSFAGLRDGLRLARKLVEQYWDDMYPVRDEEDGMLFRVAAFRGMDGGDTDGTLILPLRKQPLTVAVGDRPPLSRVDFIQAQSLERIDDPEQRSRRIDNGAITMDQFEQAVAATSQEQLADTVEDIEECIEEVILFDQLLDERCDVAADGERTAPPTGNIRSALMECMDTIKMFYAPAEEAAPDAGEGDSQQAAASGGGAGGIATPSQAMTREEAFALLLKVADYFKKTEPHSPLSYSLQQVVRWGRMPLPELLTELIRDESERERLFKHVGLPLDYGND